MAFDAPFLVGRPAVVNLVCRATDDDYVDMREAPAWEKPTRIAALVVWATIVVAVIAARVEAGIAVLLVAGIGWLALLRVRGAEIAFGLLPLVVGSVWIYFSAYLYFGLGTMEVFPASLWERAVLGSLTALGLIPLFLGVSFVFGVGPLAEPASEPEFHKRLSGRAVMAIAVAASLAMAILYVARSTIAWEGAPPGRGSWERDLGAIPGSNVGQEVEDPALVRRLREATGTSGTVDVEVTVFDAGPKGHAPAIRIQADDVLTYLGRRLNRISDAVGRSGVSFLEISDRDGDVVLVYARVHGDLSTIKDWPGWAYHSPGEGVSSFWARRDVQECFYSSSLDLPPCPIDFSR